MYKIVKKIDLNPSVSLMEIHAPEIARKAKPGQFIILRVDDDGERVPLTIASYDEQEGTVTIVFQIVGKTTRQLSEMKSGDYLLDFVGPLGKATELDGYKKVAVIGGGLGSAIAWPQARQLHRDGAEVDMICGFRNKDLIILEQEMKASCTRLFVTTDDGSNGNQGFVTDVLKKLIEDGNKYDLVIAIGPLIMMKFVSKLTLEYGIKTIVSMNPVMVDGTGMCGGCRVTVGGETKFACVDGPDFDGHQVDFDEAMRRQQFYKEDEKKSLERHVCRLTGEVENDG
ncbi:MAG: sulfide/dihydroorotate dehydrogenase-like FAD/NAD-binding protein [Eubacteriales bacterium]|nr:sulfide/dihydroorotate dehydrogenase-like FAD/NAD-binding protein [Eubacteriales bacterium]MDD3197605.1 sulfide/dihydroorotate dehydrogenase-like FAD/NAD-binding protein [Eubacteriales bacterium]MDD3503933.1 sulfide/dihydroorotate dehydrogenase-like FAD/NAD-binding protein [Eubacteriales bacterium]MDD4681871.1 sulfide/dihydroorotate dehydrogenase-like FAD/NAD-binding protein [Eubacteriales bacterium]